MKNNNWSLKLSLLMFVVFGFSLSFSSAINFHLNVEGIKTLSIDYILENMMYVHFADNGNDYGGFLYFSNGTGYDMPNLEDENNTYKVETSKSSYVCTKQMRGFYYNAQRGERLWPLDDQTWKNVSGITGLNTTGGIYTLCYKDGYLNALKLCESQDTTGYNDCVSNVRKDYVTDGFGYYGSVGQTYSGQNFNLTIGVEYTGSNGGFLSIKSGSALVPTFARISNKYPVGFIYDYNGGVGLAGCRFLSLATNSMKNLITEVGTNLPNKFKSTGTGVRYDGIGIDCSDNLMTTEDMLVKVLVEGIVGIDDSNAASSLGGFGNSTDEKMQYLGTKSVSNIALMNYAAKKAELLCRGRWTKDSHVFIEGVDVICWDGGNVSAGQAKSAKEKGQTLIVKQGNVTIEPMTGADNGSNYDIYILSGNLLIDETNASGYVINNKGFMSNTLISLFNANSFATIVDDAEKIISGCQQQDCEDILGRYDILNVNIDWNDLNVQKVDTCKSGGCMGDDATVASVIKGNFIVNGEVIGTGGSTEGKLDNKYFIYGKFTTKSSISKLENVFGWRCNNGLGSDNNFCPKYKGNPYRNTALAVIDQKYDSPLLQS